MMARPLHLAYFKNNKEITEAIEATGYSLRDHDESQRNILHYAAIHNNVSAIFKGVDT